MKKRAVVDIKSGRLFPWHFMLIAVIFLLVGLALIAERTLLSLALILASLFILSGYSGTEIDLKRGIFREYRSFFFQKSGKRLKFNSIEKIYINRSKTTRKVYTAHTNHSSVFSNVEYNAWLKLDDGRKIHLLSKSDKSKLTGILNGVSRSLMVRIEDQTLPAHNA
jgi:hypothetical protein